MRVERVTPRSDAALAALSDGTQVRAALVVAADGRDSAVREGLGIAVGRWGYGQKAVVFTVTHPLPHDGVSTEIHRSGGPFTLVPLIDRDGGPGLGRGLDGGRPAGGGAGAGCRSGAFEAALNARSCGVLRPAPAGKPAAAVADRHPGGGAARRASRGAGGRGRARRAADRRAGPQHEPQATSRPCSTSASPRATPRATSARRSCSRATTARGTATCSSGSPGSTR